MTEIESMRQWEQENQRNITRWILDLEVKPGFKVVTFYLKNGSGKQFEIPIITNVNPEVL